MIIVFKRLTVEERLRETENKNRLLSARNKELEDALVELAEIVATNEEAIQHG